MRVFGYKKPDVISEKFLYVSNQLPIFAEEVMAKDPRDMNDRELVAWEKSVSE